MAAVRNSRSIGVDQYRPARPVKPRRSVRQTTSLVLVRPGSLELAGSALGPLDLMLSAGIVLGPVDLRWFAGTAGLLGLHAPALGIRGTVRGYAVGPAEIRPRSERGPGDS